MAAGRRTDRSESYSPQSSFASGASARAPGDVSVTSSSALQSGHATISPFTASDPTVTSASHSGHFGTRESIGLVGLGRAVAAAAMAGLVEAHALLGARKERVGGDALRPAPCDAERHGRAEK